MPLYQVSSGTVVWGIGTFEDCLECVEWLENEGVNSQEIHIQEC